MLPIYPTKAKWIHLRFLLSFVYFFFHLWGCTLFCPVWFLETCQIFSLLLSNAPQDQEFLKFLYLFFIFLIVGTLPKTCESLWDVCLRVIIGFLRLQGDGKLSLCSLVAAPWWQICLVSLSFWAAPPSPRLSHSRRLRIKEQENWRSTRLFSSQRFRIEAHTS